MAEVIQIGPMGFDKNYTYLVYGSQKHALLIDATGSANAIEKEIREKGLEVVAQTVTHSHPDHTEQVPYFKEKGVPLITFEQLKLEPGFMVDDFLVRVIFTPGHAPDSVCFLVENNLFSGDTLFARGTGRTDLGGGSEREMKESLKKLSKLDGSITVWPGHNYGGARSTLKEALKNSGFK
jgi:glyoxylase-like metal-dependent hydrolase (beta-lactamase superfamily II)